MQSQFHTSILHCVKRSSGHSVNHFSQALLKKQPTYTYQTPKYHASVQLFWALSLVCGWVRQTILERASFNRMSPSFMLFLFSFKADVLPQESRECEHKTATEIYEDLWVQPAHSAKSHFKSSLEDTRHTGYKVYMLRHWNEITEWKTEPPSEQSESIWQ